MNTSRQNVALVCPDSPNCCCFVSLYYKMSAIRTLPDRISKKIVRKQRREISNKCQHLHVNSSLKRNRQNSRSKSLLRTKSQEERTEKVAKGLWHLMTPIHGLASKPMSRSHTITQVQWQGTEVDIVGIESKPGIHWDFPSRLLRHLSDLLSTRSTLSTRLRQRSSTISILKTLVRKLTGLMWSRCNHRIRLSAQYAWKQAIL